MTEQTACPRCGQPTHPTHDLCGDCWTAAGGAPWWANRNQFTFKDGPPKRGISDLVALALIALDLDIVRRVTINALCKTEHTQSSNKIAKALKRFERQQWARREDGYVRILSRDGLRSWIDLGVDVTDERAARLLAVEEAADQINSRLDEGTAISGWSAETIRRHAEIRRRELIALQRLMQAAPTRGGNVRIVPRGRAL